MISQLKPFENKMKLLLCMSVVNAVSVQRADCPVQWSAQWLSDFGKLFCVFEMNVHYECRTSYHRIGTWLVTGRMSYYWHLIELVFFSRLQIKNSYI